MSLAEDFERQEQSKQQLLNDQVTESDMSEQIIVSTKEKIEFAKAMSKFQGEITGAKKESENPFFKKNYADLASCWDAIRVPLAANGLCILQMPRGGADGVVTLETIILHTSGYSESCVMSMKPIKTGPQDIGICLTYLRRYMLSAVTGLAQVDEDGNSTGGKTVESSTNTAKPNAPSQKQLEYVSSLIKKNWNWDDFAAKYGVTKLSELDSATASDAIEELNAMVKPAGAN